MEDLELLSFNIISAVGTAKSRYVQAMYLAEKGQAVKTPASHAGNAGSIPARVTKG